MAVNGGGLIVGKAFDAILAAAGAGLAAAQTRADQSGIRLLSGTRLIFARGAGGFALEPTSRTVILLRDPPDEGLDDWLTGVVTVHRPRGAPFCWPVFASRADEIARATVFASLCLRDFIPRSDRATITEWLLGPTDLRGPEVEMKAVEALIKAGDPRWDNLGHGLDPARRARLAVLTRLELRAD